MAMLKRKRNRLCKENVRCCIKTRKWKDDVREKGGGKVCRYKIRLTKAEGNDYKEKKRGRKLYAS